MEPIGGHLISRLHALRKTPTARQSRLMHVFTSSFSRCSAKKGVNSPLNLE